MTERDQTGTAVVGDAVVDLSRSDAFIGIPFEPDQEPHDGGGLPDLPPKIAPPNPGGPGQGGGPIPPPDPSTADAYAHGDAQQAGASYAGAAGSLDAHEIYSRCDAAHQPGPVAPGLFQAYGRAGVHDLTLSLLGGGTLDISTKVLDYEIFAQGPPPSSAYQCEVVDAQVNALSGPPPELALTYCPPPNTDPTGGALSPTVVVELNEQWSVPAYWGGMSAFGGAMVHVTVALPGLTQIDVYIGYVAVAVPAETIPG